MRTTHLLTTFAAAILLMSTASAATITGDYLEARSCPVYSGECFINSEFGLSGKEALMAWKVDKGSWDGVALDGLGAALIVTAEGTIGGNEEMPMNPGKTRSVILVDNRATSNQHAALVAFVKDSAKQLANRVVQVEKVPFTMTSNHLDNAGQFRAGAIAEIHTRSIRNSDCVCTNEKVFFNPLVDVENASPAFSLKYSYQGEALNSKWTSTGPCSSFLATFRR